VVCATEKVMKLVRVAEGKDVLHAIVVMVKGIKDAPPAMGVEVQMKHIREILIKESVQIVAVLVK
jgi:hypothetical protein